MLNYFFISLFFLSSFSFISSYSDSSSCQNKNNSSSYDISKCRLIITSNTIYNLNSNNFISESGSDIIMKYDLIEDSYMNNQINKWNGGYDIYLKTAYDYTRINGPLGM